MATSAPPILRIKPAEMSARQLRRRYIAALSLIALLTILAQTVMQFLIADQEHDSLVINVAGKQRMLSQKIAKTSVYLQHAENGEKAENHRAQLREALALWQRFHKGLLDGDREAGLPRNSDKHLRALFNTVEPHYQAIVAASGTLLAGPEDAAAAKTALRAIQQHEPPYLQGMDVIVQHFEKEAKDKVRIAGRFELGLMVVTLIVLALAAFLILGPAVLRIRRDMQSLSEREADMERLFDASPTAMLMVDMDNLLIVRANQKAIEMTRMQEHELQRRTLNDMLHAGYDANRMFMEKLRDDRALNEFEVALFDTNLDVIESLVSFRVVRFGGRSVYVLGFTNINELKRAQHSLEYYATYDELTGLVNRRTGLMFLEKAMARAWRESSPLSVIFADLDSLKMANDQFGHAEGDKLLRAAANIMTGLIRASDFAVRLGGDEFLIILPNCSARNAQRIADNLERLLTSIKNDSPRKMVYAISCGIAEYSADRHTSPDDLVAEADRKMFLAKRAKKTMQG